MITSRLSGGLGNQMFQYAAGRSLSLSKRTSLSLDVSSYDKQPAHETPRAYELEFFNLPASLVKLSRVKTELPQRYPARLAVRLLQKSGLKLRVVGEPTEHTILNLPALASGNTLLVGLWQSQDYFKPHAAQIRQDFTFPDLEGEEDKKISSQIDTGLAVSVHVRRGDLITNEMAARDMGFVAEDYYPKAIDYIKAKLKDPIFFVFSDDIEWSRKNLPLGKSAVFINHNSGKTAFRDMQLMSHCQHHIVANSSFSWWGAWLNPSQDKMVVAPKRWFKDAQINKENIAPKDWIRL